MLSPTLCVCLTLYLHGFDGAIKPQTLFAVSRPARLLQQTDSELRDIGAAKRKHILSTRNPHLKWWGKLCAVWIRVPSPSDCVPNIRDESPAVGFVRTEHRYALSSPARRSVTNGKIKTESVTRIRCFLFLLHIGLFSCGWNTAHPPITIDIIVIGWILPCLCLPPALPPTAEPNWCGGERTLTCCCTPTQGMAIVIMALAVWLGRNTHTSARVREKRGSKQKFPIIRTHTAESVGGCVPKSSRECECSFLSSLHAHRSDAGLPASLWEMCRKKMQWYRSCCAPPWTLQFSWNRPGWNTES